MRFQCSPSEHLLAFEGLLREQSFSRDRPTHRLRLVKIWRVGGPWQELTADSGYDIATGSRVGYIFFGVVYPFLIFYFGPLFTE